MADNKPKTAGQSSTPDTETKVPYPKCVILILGCELCERFSYYGMKAILSIYFVTILHFSQRNAAATYHIFVAFSYATSLLGGYISDNWLGKFKTIFIISLIYVTGQTLMCITSLPIGSPQLPMTIISLITIAIGTGGIKPCVSPFGGDQFVLPQQEKHLSNFFNVFYFCINVGSALSSIISPVLREKRCFGQDTCFPLAFGLPATLMVVATIIFVAGKPLYKIRPAEKNVMAKVFKCLCHGMYKKCHHPKGEHVQHWLDRTEDKFDKDLIADVKESIRIMFLFFPAIIFWALYDQSGSTWVFQACHMNGSVGSFVILPDQMQFINPVLILIMIPVFNFGVYPLLLKCGLLKKPLSRMCCGGYLLFITFVMVSGISLILEAKAPRLPQAGFSHLRIYNSLKCTPIITSSVFDAPTEIHSMEFEMTEVKVNGEETYEWTIKNCDDLPEKQGKFSLEEKKSISYYLSKKGMISFEDDASKDEKMGGYPKIRILVDNPDIKLELMMKNEEDEEAKMKSADESADVTPTLDELSQFTVRPDEYKIMDIDKALPVKQGGVYVIFIETQDQSILDLTMVEVTPSNQIHILWQLPQYFIYTVAEIMFSISMNEFAYSQAPVGMKSFITALALINTFFGNLLTSALTAADMFEKKSSENLFFAGLMLLVMIIFTFVIRRYHYVETRNETRK